MKTRRTLAGSAALICISSATAANLSQWADEKGQTLHTTPPFSVSANSHRRIDPLYPSNAKALLAQATANDSAEGPGVLFILDASGSMKAKIGKREKIAIAKEVMTDLLRDLPATIRVGLEVYGHHTKGDCDDIEVMAPVGQADKATLIQRIQAIDPKGMTPITRALQVAAEQLKTAEQETTVVLVSDGEETCKGDPCAATGSLLQQGIKLKVHVVGFDVTEKEQRQLTCIAKAGNGRYFTAQNAEQLKTALAEVRQEVVRKIEVQAEKPPTPANQKVIKIQRPEIGTIEIKNNMTGFVEILDQQTGEKKAAFCNGCNSNTQVPAGIYRLKFKNFTVDRLELSGGEKKIFDTATVAGIIEIKNNMSGSVQILDQQTGEMKAEFCNGCGSNTQLLPGTYKLKFPNFSVEGIELQAGATRVFDAHAVAGTIEIKNFTDSGFVQILDQQTSEKKAQFCNGCGSNTQVAAGTYKLQYPNFTAENIVVEAGQNVIIE